MDDEERARRSLSKYLDWHALGLHVAATLEDGSDAIAYLQKHPVDAVLTDIQMFEVSGLELARWIQANCRETRVVILSGYDEIKYVHAAIQSEAVDFLVKPVLKDALVRAFEKVRKKLDEQRAGRYSLRYLTSPDVAEVLDRVPARGASTQPISSAVFRHRLPIAAFRSPTSTPGQAYFAVTSSRRVSARRI